MDAREAALADSPAIAGTLAAPSVTAAQLHKLQELRQKRLCLKHFGSCSEGSREEKKKVTGSRASASKTRKLEASHEGDEGGKAETQTQGLKKRQKLYWGLDTKERWERKGNM